jgi:hypothetical protein
MLEKQNWHVLQSAFSGFTLLTYTLRPEDSFYGWSDAIYLVL